MGAVLEFAARKGVPLMMYVFSDGSLSSNGMIDNDVRFGRGKGEWTSDNQDTACAVLPRLQPGPRGRRSSRAADGLTAAQHQQLGAFSADGNVVRTGTPGANNVNLLVETVLLELHGAARRSKARSRARSRTTVSATTRVSTGCIAFAPIVNGAITSPV